MMEKLTPPLLREMRSRPDEEIPIIVKYRPEALQAGLLPSALLRRVRYQFQLLPAAATNATSARIDSLSREEGVEKIWLDLPVYTCLDTSVPIIQAPRVWNEGHTGQGVVIAILDTGLDPEHPDLAEQLIAAEDFTGEGLADANGHGTHVAGIACGRGLASAGKFTGVAPGATLIAAKVLGADGQGRMSDVIAGIEWAVRHRARVINLSLGSPNARAGDDALAEAGDAAVERGVVVCVAAGNGGPAPATIGSPGAARRVITVGAATDVDRVANFSAQGPTEDGRAKPDLLFPGAEVIACRARGTALGNPLDERYTMASGTSMAAAHLSGAAALLLEARPSLTPAQVKELLKSTAADLGYEVNTQGAGRADIYRALLAEPRPTAPKPKGCLFLPLSLLVKGDG